MLVGALLGARAIWSGEAVKCANNAVVKESDKGTIILLRFVQRRCAGDLCAEAKVEDSHADLSLPDNNADRSHEHRCL
jgi:hypothetical protein